MARVTVVNDEPIGGEVISVQVDGQAQEILFPGEQTTVHLDTDENDCVISVIE